MRKILLPATSLRLSRFVFGCAGLFNAGGAPARQNLLAAAADCGFSHFDTAPSYGFGMAERDLGPLLKSRPELTATTKIGLYSPGGEESSASAIFLRKVAGRVLPGLSKAQVDFSLTRAQKSLEGSLRRLGRDHVELLLLHAPRLDQLDAEEWRVWLEKLVASGRIGAFGLAATRTPEVHVFLDRAPALAAVVQAPDSLDLREIDLLVACGAPPQLTYGYVAAARRRGDPRPITDILRQALRRNASGAIVVGTTRPERLRQYVQAAESE